MIHFCPPTEDKSTACNGMASVFTVDKIKSAFVQVRHRECEIRPLELVECSLHMNTAAERRLVHHVSLTVSFSLPGPSSSGFVLFDIFCMPSTVSLTFLTHPYSPYKTDAAGLHTPCLSVSK